MGEELCPEQGHQVGQGPREAGVELEVLKEQQGDQGRPELGVEGVCTRPHEGLDLQVLLQRLEQEHDLPAVPIDPRAGGGAEFQVVGQEHQDVPRVRIRHLDAAEGIRAFRGRPDSGEFNELVPDDAPALGDGPGPDGRVDRVGLQPGDEEDPGLDQAGEPGVVHVAPVDDQDRASRKAEGLGPLDLVAAPLGDDHEAWQVAAVVQEQVELHRPLGPAGGRPVEQALAEINHRGVQAEELVLEPELPPDPGHGLAAAQQLEADRPVEGPGAMFVGVGQGGPLRGP